MKRIYFPIVLAIENMYPAMDDHSGLFRDNKGGAIYAPNRSQKAKNKKRRKGKK